MTAAAGRRTTAKPPAAPTRALTLVQAAADQLQPTAGGSASARDRFGLTTTPSRIERGPCPAGDGERLAGAGRGPLRGSGAAAFRWAGPGCGGTCCRPSSPGSSRPGPATSCSGSPPGPRG
ncbi:hypothetical protein SSCG_02160 [Streptomyces clavuligerus]|nr:hypothetical protein SSCG_02160 [Streptomyces clavuligerus]